jgi:hypothetical protein
MVDTDNETSVVEFPTNAVAVQAAQTGTVVQPVDKTLSSLRKMETAIGKALLQSAKADRDSGGALLAIRVFKLWKLHTVKSASGRDVPEYTSFSKYTEAMWPQSQARISQLVKAANEANIAFNAQIEEGSEQEPLPTMVLATRNTTARATTYPVIAERILTAMDKNVAAWRSQLEQVAALEDADAQADFNELLDGFFAQWDATRNDFVDMAEYVGEPASDDADSNTVAES